MAGARTWMLHLNLDEFNAAFAALGDDVERSQFLAGLSRGMNGGACRADSVGPWQEGFDLGSAMRVEADGFREKKQRAGEASAVARREKFGTASPEHRSGKPRTPFEHCSNTPRTPLEPIHNPQSTILKPESEGEAPPEPPPPPAPGKDLIAGKKRTWAPLFQGIPDAQAAKAHYAAVVDAQDEMLARLRKRPNTKPPRLDPSPGARAFVALVQAGWSPRVLRACHACYLKCGTVVQDGFLQLLETFFGMPGTKSKATFEGFAPEAERLLATFDSRLASGGHSQPNVPHPTVPLVPASALDALQAAGIPLPLEA